MIVNPILYQQGTKLPELTNPGSAADLLAGKQLVDQYGNPLTGTMPEVEQAVPGISIDANGLITASAVQEAGHVAAGTRSATKQLTKRDASSLSASGAAVTVPAGYYPSQVSKSVATAAHPKPTISRSGGTITAQHVQSAGYTSGGTTTETLSITTQSGKTVTPGTSRQTAVASGRLTTGAVYVAGDANLVAANIKSGVSIFGVAGSYAGQSVLSYSLDNATLSGPDSNGRIAVSGVNIGTTENLLVMSAFIRAYYKKLGGWYLFKLGFINNTQGGLFLHTQFGNESLGILETNLAVSNQSGTIYIMFLFDHSQFSNLSIATVEGSVTLHSGIITTK